MTKKSKPHRFQNLETKKKTMAYNSHSQPSIQEFRNQFQIIHCSPNNICDFLNNMITNDHDNSDVYRMNYNDSNKL